MNYVFQALRKEPLTVYGDGKQTRSFQYVSDLVGPSITPKGGHLNKPANTKCPDTVSYTYERNYLHTGYQVASYERLILFA